MSTYNGRRGPNASQYLRDLNTISPQDTTGADDNGNFNYGGDDLAIFTNTEFFDFDSGQNMDFQAQPVKNDASSTTSPANAEIPSSANSVMGDLTTMDYMTGKFFFFSPSSFRGQYLFPAIWMHHLAGTLWLIWSVRGPFSSICDRHQSKLPNCLRSPEGSAVIESSIHLDPHSDPSSTASAQAHAPQCLHCVVPQVGHRDLCGVGLTNPTMAQYLVIYSVHFWVL